MENFYNENNINELYRKIAQEIWNINPYVDLNFPKFPNIWLTVKAHIFYKGEPATFSLYVTEEHEQTSDFIKAVARRINHSISKSINEREEHDNDNN